MYLISAKRKLPGPYLQGPQQESQPLHDRDLALRTESVPVGPKKPRQSNVGKVPKRKRRAPKEATNDTMAKYGKQFCFIIIQLIII